MGQQNRNPPASMLKACKIDIRSNIGPGPCPIPDEDIALYRDGTCQTHIRPTPMIHAGKVKRKVSLDKTVSACCSLLFAGMDKAIKGATTNKRTV